MILRYCSKCETYTLQEECCSQKTTKPQPPKYSPQDRYGEYRRKAKRREGLL